MYKETAQEVFSVVLAVDGSEHAYAAASLLNDLALPQGSKVTILSALLPRNAPEHGIPEAMLQTMKNSVAEKGWQVNTELLTGYPAEIITHYVDVYRPNLLILGAKGLRATAEILLGGVAQNVIEYALCPVLVVRAPYKELHKVLLAVDGSQYSQWALDYLIKFPLPQGVELHLMHVLPPAQRMGPEVYHQMFRGEIFYPLPSQSTLDLLQSMIEEEERNGKAILAQAEDCMVKAGMDPVPVIRTGDAATEILEYIRSHQIDLTVVGSRGLGRIKGWLLGSVSRKITHYGSSSVLIVKGGWYGEN